MFLWWRPVRKTAASTPARRTAAAPSRSWRTFSSPDPSKDPVFLRRSEEPVLELRMVVSPVSKSAERELEKNWCCQSTKTKVNTKVFWYLHLIWSIETIAILISTLHLETSCKWLNVQTYLNWALLLRLDKLVEINFKN